MNECQQLHETIVRDILDVIDDVKDYDEVEWLNKRNNTGSIARRAANLTLVFPVIVSTSLSIQTASMISKAIERKCVALMQILFSSVQLTNTSDLVDYLKLFHTNMDLKTNLSLDDYMKFMDDLVDEGAITVTDKDAYEAVKEDMKNLNFYLPNTYNPVSLNDYRIRKNVYGESTVVCEDYRKDIFSDDGRKLGSVIYFTDDDNDTTGTGGSTHTTSNNNNNTHNNNAHNNNNNGHNNNGHNNNNNGLSNSNRSDYVRPSLKDTADYFRYQLTQAEINKANELMPTIMIVNFVHEKDGVKVPIQGIVGIKAKLYPVNSMDIVTRIASKQKESNGLFNLVRASTREISFFKDLAFAIDKAKIDAINVARDSNNARIFKLLERRAAKNKFSTLLKKNDASPITSLVMSQDEVEYLKKYNSIDMEKPYVAKTILDKFNLMDIVIVDESLETAKFLFDDGDYIYEAFSFDALEKEAKDGSYKKVVNLVSKLTR